MKAQILKIAGVKTEAEFYKKFPSEEAFMKKHGKELKKAQYGTYVAGQKEQPEQKPIMYNDLQQDMMARITGVSKQEKARQEALATMAAGKSSGGDGMGGLVGQLGSGLSSMLSGSGSPFDGGGVTTSDGQGMEDAISGALGKNGKKLKKCSTAGWDKENKVATGCTYVQWLQSDY